MVPRAVQRAVVRLAGTSVGSTGMRWLLPPLDRLTVWATRGRRTLTGLIVPTLLLVTTGRRSGRPREQPLVYLPEGGGWAIVGSNWGQRTHPAWSHNLLANPEARIVVDGTATDVRAELVTGSERARIYARFEAIVPSYRRYARTAGDREIRVFVLHPS